MSVIIEVLADDLAAFKESILSYKFEGANMFANRFTANAVLLSPNELKQYLIFLGEILKIVAEDYLQLFPSEKERRKVEKKVIDEGEDLVNAINKYLPDAKGQLDKICSAFLKFEEFITDQQQSKLEKNVYHKVEEASGAAREKLTAMLCENRELMFRKENEFVLGVINEFVRICRNHGFDVRDLCFYAVIKSLGLLHPYLKVYSTFQNVKSRSKFMETYNSIVENALTFLNSLDNIEDEQLWQKTSEVVAPIMEEWRKSFIYFTDVPLRMPTGIELTLGIKEKVKVKEIEKEEDVGR